MAQPSIDQAFQIALQHHQAGRLAQAEPLYRQILLRQPNHPDALHLLGVIAHQVGRNESAVDLIRRAITLRPNWPEAHSNLGEALRVLGRFDEAIASFRQAIKLNPNYPEAHNNLGNALRAQGQQDEAIAAYRQAIALKAGYAEAHNNLGNALRAQGYVDEAIASYRQAIVFKPGYPDALNNLGSLLRAKGQVAEALAAYRQVAVFKPNDAAAHYNLANSLIDKGRRDEAIVAYCQAISLNPNYPEAHTNLGAALNDKGKYDEAIAAYRRAIVLKPDYPETHNNLGNALRAQGRFDEAIAAYNQAIALRPNYPDAHSNRGAALKDIGQLDEAIADYRRAIGLSSAYDQAQTNLGAALHSKGDLDAAIAAFRHAIALNPNSAEAHHNLALLLLLRGEFAQGWEEYEWRWRCKSFGSPRRSASQPQWNGEPLAGATLLLHDEQGFGDTLQFIRYLPMVARRGGKIILECQPQVRRLVHSIAGDAPIVSRGEPLPPYDVHCPLATLPGIFKTALDSIPAEVPYLFPASGLVEIWRQKLDTGAPGLRVALAWAGNPKFTGDRTRSLSLNRLVPLANVARVTFHSIQKGNAARQADNPPAGLQLVDLGPQLHDFADTAAAICSMDLVITTDTSVAHLAGALGRPVWVMLQYIPDWRWLLDREDSPWYPTMRLFRQPSMGDWDSVIRRVADALAAKALFPERTP